MSAGSVKKTSPRNGKIELLRFIFCMAVLLFHCEKYVLGEPSLEDGYHLSLFCHGSMGVFLPCVWSFDGEINVKKNQAANRTTGDSGTGITWFSQKKNHIDFSNACNDLYTGIYCLRISKSYELYRDDGKSSGKYSKLFPDSDERNKSV